MAFQSVEDYDLQKYKYSFRLDNDLDSEEVIFLYREKRDMLKGDAHYISSPEYSGYVECLGAGCPACAQGIPVQKSKIFIPLYVISTGEIKFWDRNGGFQHQMERDVFSRYANPSEYVFEITRHGEWRDRNTKYEIKAKYRNTSMPYDQILATCGATFPAFYNNVCKEYSASELSKLLTSTAAPAEELAEYKPTPRAGFSALPETYVDTSNILGSDNTQPVVDIPATPEPVTADTSDDDGEYPEPQF